MSLNQGQDETPHSSSNIDSSSKSYKYNNAIIQYKDAEPKKDLSRILLMGLRGCGKTALVKVVFENMSTSEIPFINSTSAVQKYVIDSSEFLKFKIYEFPGHLDFTDPKYKIESLFKKCDLIVFVIDVQDAIECALDYLQSVVTKAYNVNREIKCEVLIHKTDGISEDIKLEFLRDIHQRANNDLVQFGEHNIYIGFYLTTIYDYSVFEAFSKIVQKLISQYSILEHFLNIITSTSRIDKAYLLDVKTKMYIATDSTPVDMQSYEFCCEMIDFVMDILNIYGSDANRELTDNPSPVFDDQITCVVKVNNGTVLYLREVSDCLGLVCILREDNFETQRIIDYNFGILRDGMRKLFKLNENESSLSNKKKQAGGLAKVTRSLTEY